MLTCGERGILEQMKRLVVLTAVGLLAGGLLVIRNASSPGSESPPPIELQAPRAAVDVPSRARGKAGRPPDPSPPASADRGRPDDSARDDDAGEDGDDD